MTSGGGRMGGAKPKAVGMGVRPYVPAGVEGSLAELPEELSESGRQVWEILVPDLSEQGVFRPSDTIMVVELCELLAEAREFRRRLQRLRARQAEVERRLADTVMGSEEYDALEKTELAVDGSLRRARTGWIQTIQRAQSLAAEWGVSPVARIRLGLNKVQGESLVAALRKMAEDEDDDLVAGEVLSDD